MNKENFYKIVTNIFKTLFLITILTLFLPMFQKDPQIMYIAFVIFISSITTVLYIYMLFNRYSFFILTLLLSMTGYTGILSIAILIKPESIKFFTDFDILLKSISVILVFVIRYFLKKKDLLFPVFFYFIRHNKTPQS